MGDGVGVSRRIVDACFNTSKWCIDKVCLRRCTDRVCCHCHAPVSASPGSVIRPSRLISSQPTLPLPLRVSVQKKEKEEEGEEEEEEEVESEEVMGVSGRIGRGSREGEYSRTSLYQDGDEGSLEG